MISGLRLASARSSLKIEPESAVLLEVCTDETISELCQTLALSRPRLVVVYGKNAKNVHDEIDNELILRGFTNSSTIWCDDETVSEVVEEFCHSLVGANTTNGLGYVIEVGEGHLLSALTKCGVTGLGDETGEEQC